MHNVGCFLMQLLLLAGGLGGALLLGEAALVAFLFLQMILANLLVLKLVMLFGLEVTACDAFAISALIAMNLLRHTYGPDSAFRAVVTTLLLTALTVAILAMHNSWIPAPHDVMHDRYVALLSPVLSVFLASLSVSALVLVLDAALFHMLSVGFAQTSLWHRMMVSILLSQAVDTFLFTLFALGPWVVDFWSLFLWSYWVKVITVLVLVPMTLAVGDFFRLGFVGVRREDHVQI